jgi:hypothetical protein
MFTFENWALEIQNCLIFAKPSPVALYITHLPQRPVIQAAFGLYGMIQN